MKLCESGLLLAILAASPAAAASAGQLSLMIDGGRVTLVATDVTAEQILEEWARVGQTTVVNGDDLPDSPVTLRLTSVPEKLALDVILRSASGYIAVPRRAENPGASFYDRILVLDTKSVEPPPQHIAPPPVSAETQSQAGVPGPAWPAPEVGREGPQEDEQDDAQVLPLRVLESGAARETPRLARGVAPGATNPVGFSQVPGIVTPVPESRSKPMPD